MSSHAVLIYNLGAGRPRRQLRDVERMVAALRARGLAAAARMTRGPGDATRLAREGVAEGASLVIVHGGDGTVNEALQPLVDTRVTHSASGREGPPTRWPRSWAFRGDSAPWPICWRPAGLGASPWGGRGNRYFILMAGIGLAAAALRDVNPTLKRMVGVGASWVAALKQMMGPPPERFVVEADGRRHTATVAVITNAATYGGGLRFTPHARMDDDVLDVCLIDSNRCWLLPRYLAAVRSGTHLALPGVAYLKTRRLFASPEGQPWVHADGELLGPLPVTFACVPP